MTLKLKPCSIYDVTNFLIHTLAHNKIYYNYQLLLIVIYRTERDIYIVSTPFNTTPYLPHYNSIIVGKYVCLARYMHGHEEHFVFVLEHIIGCFAGVSVVETPVICSFTTLALHSTNLWRKYCRAYLIHSFIFRSNILTLLSDVIFRCYFIHILLSISNE